MTRIGIDFGDKTSCAAILRNGRAELVPSRETGIFGDKSFPSCVALTFDERILVGEPARRQAAENPNGTATGFKWLLARQKWLMLRKRGFSPERLAAFLLEKIKQDAETFTRSRITAAVVGVPPDFEADQRQALSGAAKLAGFDRVLLMEEPSAAAAAYGLCQQSAAGAAALSLVVDFGGSGLTISVLEHAGNDPRLIASTRWPDLGGGAMDEALFQRLAQSFATATAQDVAQDPKAATRLREAAEIARIELSDGRTSVIKLPILFERSEAANHAELILTQSELAQVVAPILSRCREAAEEALGRARLGLRDFGPLILVGGLMRMDLVRDLFQDVYGRRAETGVDPAHAVAIGAANRAAAFEAEGSRKPGGRDARA
jgi:molecular chaperone DnaK